MKSGTKGARGNDVTIRAKMFSLWSAIKQGRTGGKRGEMSDFEEAYIIKCQYCGTPWASCEGMLCDCYCEIREYENGLADREMVGDNADNEQG